MKDFILTVKHDNGKIKLRVKAEDEAAAKQQVMKAEGCPERAIIDVKPAAYKKKAKTPAQPAAPSNKEVRQKATVKKVNDGWFSLFSGEERLFKMSWKDYEQAKLYGEQSGYEVIGGILPNKEVLNITKGLDEGVIFIRGANSRVLADLPNDKTGNKDAADLCNAYNETYGKGYNPAAMDELYKALDNAIKIFMKSTYPLELANEVSIARAAALTALNNARL